MSSIASTRNAAVDPAEFEGVYDEFSRQVFSYCIRILRSHDDAADATQNAFMSLLRRFSSIPESEPSRSAYVFTVARHACFDLMRRRKHTTFIDDIEDDYQQRQLAFSQRCDHRQPDECAEGASERSALYAAIRGLPERHRRALVLRELCDLSYDEIADDMGLNRNAVAQLLSRARGALTREVNRNGDLELLAVA